MLMMRKVDNLSLFVRMTPRISSVNWLWERFRLEVVPKTSTNFWNPWLVIFGQLQSPYLPVFSHFLQAFIDFLVGEVALGQIEYILEILFDKLRTEFPTSWFSASFIYLFNIYTQMSRGYWVEGGSALPAIRAAFYYQIYITSNIQSIFIHCIRLHGGWLHARTASTPCSKRSTPWPSSSETSEVLHPDFVPSHEFPLLQ